MFAPQIELQIMARLSHPNIVRVYGGCLTPPNLFVVAELMEGDLSDRIHNLVAAEGATDEGVQGTGTGMHPRVALTAALDIIRGLVRYRSLVRYRGRVRYRGLMRCRGLMRYRSLVRYRGLVRHMSLVMYRGA